MLVLPLVIPVGIALIVWAAILLGRKKAGRRAPLIGAIVALGISIVVVTVIGAMILTAESIGHGSVTLVED